MPEQTFVDLLEKIYADKGYCTRREVGVGYGIADLVLIKKTSFNLKKISLRNNYLQKEPLLKDYYFKILRHVPDIESGKDPIDLDKLVSKSRLSKGLVKYRILKTLEKFNYIKKESNNYYYKINGWLPIANEVIAVEAKIKDWKKGFIQAVRYRAFADKVYLAFPMESLHLVDTSLLTKHNVGLIGLDYCKEKMKIINHAKKLKVIDNYKKCVAMEYFWEDEILRSSSSITF